MAIIVTHNLTKKFKELVAVDNVSLEIEDGENFGLLGPNGAGKTSLIRMITAVSPPASGDITVLGKDLKLFPREIKAALGVVPQIDNLDEDLTVLKNLTTFARYFDIPKHEAYQRSMEVLALFKLEDKQKSRLKELSGGMKRRLLLARGLLNRPKILILDEPSVGLDPQSRRLVWQKLAEFKSQGVTELLTTQNMDEAAVLCDRVAIMHQAHILTVDTPHALITKYVGEEVTEIQLDSADKSRIIEELKRRNLDFVEADNTIEVFHTNKDGLAGIVAGSSARVRDRVGTLEDVFFRLTGITLVE